MRALFADEDFFVESGVFVRVIHSFVFVSCLLPFGNSRKHDFRHVDEVEDLETVHQFMLIPRLELIPNSSTLAR